MIPPRTVLMVIPAFNEERSISEVVQRAVASGFNVLVVDDGSTDSTACLARLAGALVVSLPFNLGVGVALRSGLQFAVRNGYQVVAQCDADGQHPPEEVRKLLEELENSNVDMVLGSRFRGHSGPVMHVSRTRRLVMKLLARSASKACATTITDSTSGFRVIREPLLTELSTKMPSYYLGDTYEVLVAAGRSGYRVKEVPIAFRDRQHGVSSATSTYAARQTIKALLAVLLRMNTRLAQVTKRHDK